MEPSGHVFGPVPSRRLGRSLGVDLVPLKTCSYDCIYCQLGRTRDKTVERHEYVPLRDVLDEVRCRLQEDAPPEYVALSGSGEPTLHSRIGDVIAGIQELTDIPIAVLTNGSLLWNDEVVDALARADVILPSLDVGDAALFQHVNRPHGSISFDAMVGGLEGLRDRCRGEIWLEVLLLAGVTGLDAEVRKIEAIVERIRPDRVQLNTAVRPTAEEFAFALSREEMQRLAQCMGPNSEIIANFRGVHEAAQFRAKREDVLRVLERRPCTVRDLAASLSLHVNEATKYVGELEQKGQVVLEAHYGALYYRARGLPEEVK